MKRFMIGHYRKLQSIHIVSKSFTKENTTANASFSVWEYLVSASDNEQLAKATG